MTEKLTLAVYTDVTADIIQRHFNIEYEILRLNMHDGFSFVLKCDPINYEGFIIWWSYIKHYCLPVILCPHIELFGIRHENYSDFMNFRLLEKFMKQVKPTLEAAEMKGIAIGFTKQNINYN